MLFEERLLFFPVRYPRGEWDQASRLGLRPEEVEVRTSDGVRLHGWYLTSPARDAPVLLIFSGNGGNLSLRADFLRRLLLSGCDVFNVDYRGYGKSEGRPSEKGFYLDGEAAFHHLVIDRGVDPRRIVFLGRSLGGGVAMEMAIRHPEAGGLVLESTFRSILHMGKRRHPYLPLRFLLHTRFDNLGKAPRLRLPVLVIHGTHDEVIPLEEGRALFDALPAGVHREIYLIDGAHHSDTAPHGGEEYARRIRAFVGRSR